MKYFPALILILNTLVFIKCSEISKVLSDAINAIFIDKEIYFDIIIYGKATHHIMDILDEIGKSIGGNFTTKIQFCDPHNWNHKVTDSAVIISSSFSSLLSFHDSIYLDNDYYKNLKFLAYSPELSMYNMVTIFEGIESPSYLAGRIEQFMYYLVNEYDHFKLATFDWFSEITCDHPKFTVLNVFFKNYLQKWEKELKIEEKFTNFHRCELTLCYMDRRRLTWSWAGGFYDLFTAMALKANFTPNFRKIEVHELPNGEVKEIEITYLCHFRYFPIYIFPFFVRHSHSTTKFYRISYRFALTPYLPYTAFEKMLLPFDQTTWILLIIIFSYAFASIPIINFVSRKVKDIFYGKDVSTPAFNIVAIVFGIGQTKLPEANFPRILLTTFLWFCLIFRTAYQSLLFEYEATNIRKSLPKTLDELENSNFTIITHFIQGENWTDLFPDNLRLNTKVLSFDEFHNQKDKYDENVGSNLAFFTIEFISQSSTVTGLFKSLPYEPLKEEFMSYLMGYLLTRNNFLFTTTDDTVQALLAAGILQYKVDESFGEYGNEYKKGSNDDDDLEKQPITYDELSYGFTLWYIACLVCYIVFLLELTTYYIHMEPIYHIRNIVGLCLLLRVLFKHYRN